MIKFGYDSEDLKSTISADMEMLLRERIREDAQREQLKSRALGNTRTKEEWDLIERIARAEKRAVTNDRKRAAIKKRAQWFAFMCSALLIMFPLLRQTWSNFWLNAFVSLLTFVFYYFFSRNSQYRELEKENRKSADP